MGAEGTTIPTATTAAATKATMGMAGLAATTIAEDITSQKTAEQTAIREHNPLFQSMGTEEAVMAVANSCRVDGVTAVEMAVTAMEAATNLMQQQRWMRTLQKQKKQNT